MSTRAKALAPPVRCLFRVAAGPRVGYGHLMRARALAESLGLEGRISIRGGRAATRAATAIGCRLADEGAALERADLLVVDDPSLECGRAWIARARQRGIRSVSVHDGSGRHDADLVVCGSLGIRHTRASDNVLSGVRFYLLDRRIAEARAMRVARPPVARPGVLIALGGGGHVRRVAQQLVDAVRRRRPDAEIVVAAGFSRGRRPRLRHARWLSARTGLLTALLNTDVAIVAGGVTLYEACALGVPSVALAVVPEQRRTIRAFARRGAVIDAGGASASPAAIAAAAAGVIRLLDDRRLREATSSRARHLVDGRGTERVARRIRAMLAQGARTA